MKKRPEIFQNERVSASAGSGKTYALTKRFIALAENSKDPETGLPDPTRITALTFTRKAAGEFLSNILRRLADAALDDSAARRLSEEIEELTFGEKKSGTYIARKDALELLEQCAKNIGAMRLSTIDSFFSSALKAFANESGVFSQIRIVESSRMEKEKAKIINDILRANSADQKTFSEFLEIVRRASFGNDEKSLRGALNDQIDACRAMFLDVPDPLHWGRAESITGGKTPKEWDAAKYAAALAELEGLVENSPAQPALEGVVNFFKTSNDKELGKSGVAYERVAKIFADGGLGGSSFEIEFRKKTHTASAQIADKIAELLQMLCHAHIIRACQAAGAAAQIAQMFEERYGKNVRLAGMLTFDDVPALLENASPALSQLLEYRLDARFDHWLFDEFQDTSRRQWKFFENIMDEIAASGDGKKTFYYVGDVKQSIYSFRGGDRFLFDEIFRRYNAMNPEGGAIFDGGNLSTSHRSGANVIKAINSFFADENDLACAFHPEAAREFIRIFVPHTSFESLPGAKPAKPSCARLAIAESGDAVFEEVFKIIREIDPARRGITCAVLVRKNKTVGEFAEFLRRRIDEENLSIKVACELEKPIAEDNMAVPAFAQMLKFAAHPSDTAAQKYLSMCPLAQFAASENFREEILSEVAERGFESLAGLFAKKLESALGKIPPQAEENLDRLADACREFDNSDSNGIDAFLEFLDEKKFRLTSLAESVQIMTVHKSKGLGFDAVILPDLHKSKSPSIAGLQYVLSEENGAVSQKTIAYMPPGEIRMAVPALRQTEKIFKRNRAFDDICALYVALTRAKRALYVVMPRPKKLPSGGLAQLAANAFIPGLRGDIPDKEKSKIFDDAAERRGITFGDINWHKSFEGSMRCAAPDILPALKNPKPYRPPETLSPSKAAGSAEFFDLKNAELGTAVHAAFQNVEASDADADGRAERAAHKARLCGEAFACAKKAVRGALENPAIAEYFAPRKNVKYEAEFSFDALVGGKRAKGCIDRIALSLDESGAAKSAVVIDFKRTAAQTPQRAEQLSIYKQAVEKIFNLPPESVRAKIISYSDAKIFDA